MEKWNLPTSYEEENLRIDTAETMWGIVAGVSICYLIAIISFVFS